MSALETFGVVVTDLAPGMFPVVPKGRGKGLPEVSLHRVDTPSSRYVVRSTPFGITWIVAVGPGDDVKDARRAFGAVTGRKGRHVVAKVTP